MDDTVVPANFKQHRFTSTKQPTREAITRRVEKQRALKSVKDALMNAFDTLGNEAFFVQLGRGSAEDRRCLAMILAKLLPIEVQGALDASLTVKVISLADAGVEIDLSRMTPKGVEVGAVPKDAVPSQALIPVTHGEGRAPEDA